MSQTSKIHVENPATLDIVRTLEVSDPVEIDGKIEGASAAFESWSGTSMAARRKILSQISKTLIGNTEEIAKTLTREQGKPLLESRAEVSAAASVFQLYADMEFPRAESVRDDEEALIKIGHHPVGTCALILPWNYPVGLLSWKLAPALLAGNTVIVKPSEHAPLAVGQCLDLANRSLPGGVAEIVIGGEPAGKHLAGHPGISKISFTGGQSTGRSILESAAPNLTRVTLELGGNDAAIILPDCDLKKRLDAIFWGAFRNAGQICIAIKRLYVHESRVDEATRLLAAKADTLKIGNGLNDGVLMGPLCNRQQLARAEDLLRRSKNGHVVTTGSPMPDTGHFMPPTIMRVDNDKDPIVAEEQFAPILPILAYSDVDEAVARANATSFGLGGSVWSENTKAARATASRLQCGTAWLNAHMLVEHGSPFGGWKNSGFGRELGKPGLFGFLQSKTLYEKKN